MPRFVLLYHDCPPEFGRPSHWDLMLEHGQALRTWAIYQLPCDWDSARALTALLYPACSKLADGNEVAAEELPDHRLAYLEIEGPLTGNRGAVCRVAAGEYEPRDCGTDAEAWMFAGEVMRGVVSIREGRLRLVALE